MYDAMCDEAIAFAAYVHEGRTESPIHPHHELLSVMGTIDAVRPQLAQQH